MIETSQNELTSLLDILNIKKDDKLLIHSSLYSLGKMNFNKKRFLEIIKRHIGAHGVIVMPSFSYSFRRGEVFDPNLTPVSVELGSLPEFFRMENKVNRTWDGLFSFCCDRPLSSDFKKAESICFGNNSYFEYLVSQNFKLLSLGVKFSKGITPFIHAERLANVPYREEKNLTVKFFTTEILDTAHQRISVGVKNG